MRRGRAVCLGVVSAIASVSGGVALASAPGTPIPPTTEAEWTAQLEAWEQAHAPASLADRQASQSAYEDLSAGESLNLLQQTFPDYVSGLDEHVLANPSDQVRRYVDDRVAIVDPTGPHQRELVVSSLPLRVSASDGGEQLADPDLENASGGYDSTAIGVDLTIPSDIANGIELGDDGFALGVPDPGSASAARPVSGDEGIYYSDIAPDVGMVVSPITGGFSFGLQIMSAEAPERIRLPLDLPAGSTISIDQETGFAVVAASDDNGVMITSPVALDADGRPVSTKFEADNGDLILVVNHSQGTPHLPILVDPYVMSQQLVSEDTFEGTGNFWAAPQFRGWTVFEGQRGGSLSDAYPYTPGWADLFGSGTNTGGLWTGVPQNTPLSANLLGGWREQVPNWDVGTSAYYNYVQFQTPAVSTANGGTFPFPLLEYGIYARSRSGWAYNASNASAGNAGAAYNYYYGTFAEPGGSFWMGPTNDGAAKEIDFQLNCGPWGTAGNLPMRLGYLGGVTTYIADLEWPTVSSVSQVPPTWTNQPPANASVVFDGHDAGLGIQAMHLRIGPTASQPITDKTEAIGCAGWHSLAACPQHPRKTFSIDTTQLPEGQTGIYGRAVDVLGKDSGYVKVGDFGVDRGAPTVTVSGGLRNGASDGYGLTINATDGDPASASSARSGVKRVNLIADPGTASERVLFSRTQACSDPRASCPLAPENKTFNLTDAPVTAGLHEFRLTVSDAAGNATAETWTKTIRSAPTIEASGDGFDAGKTLISARPHLSSVIKPGLYPIAETTVTVDGVVVDRQTSTDLQGAAVCDSDGACTIEQDWDPNLASVSAGSHQLMITAKDSAGVIVNKSTTVTVDPTAPTLTASGVLVDRDGLQLNASSAAVDIAVSDATSPAQQSGIARIAVAVTRGPDTPVASETLLAPSCSPACPADSQASWTYSTATWGPGSATVAVVVRDRAGNEASRSIAVNTPPYEPDAACQTRAAQLVPTGTSVSGSAAATNAEDVLPSLTDPVTGVELVQRAAGDSLESAPGAVRRMPLHVEGGSSDTAMAERMSEGVMLNQSACLVPSKSTTASTPAVLVDDSAAVFANTNTDTDTVVKATSDGAAIVELARGNGAPDEFSYEVDLRPGLQVVELANDGVAIIDPAAQPDQGTPPSVSPGARDDLGEVLTDVELQQDIGESELASAESELGVDVVSVLEAPVAYSATAGTSLTDASENTAANGRKGKIHKVGPAKLKVTVPPPPPAPTKKQAVVVLTHNDFDKADCERGSSPCGDFHVGLPSTMP